MNDVSFTLASGGLGRPLPGKDFVSAMLFYTAVLPSGFSSTSRIKKIFSIEDAEALGILDDFNDETKAAASYTVTGVGADGDTIELTVAEPRGAVSLGIYTKVTADTTVTNVADAIVLIINAGTLTHGYTATNVAGLITIVARPGLGIFLNSGTPLVATIVGTITGTIAQFGVSSLADGVASLQSIYHYHISEFFRIQPKGELYIAFYAVPSTYNFTDLVTIQQYANGEIRRAFVFANGTTHTTGKVQAAQAVANALFLNHMPLSSILLVFNIFGQTLVAQPDLNLLNSKKVSIIISQDGDAKGWEIFKATGKSITNAGAILGLGALANVQEDIGWVGKFNLSDGTENNVAAFSNGDLYSAQTPGLITQLDTYRYIFGVKYVGTEGTFVNDSHTAVLPTSDYAYIENNQVIDKAVRLLYSGLISELKSPLVVNANGTLKDTTIAHFESIGNVALDQMERDGEVSAKLVTVDSTQNVLTSSELVVAVSLVPVGVARNIVVKIGFKLSIQ